MKRNAGGKNESEGDLKEREREGGRKREGESVSQWMCFVN